MYFLTMTHTDVGRRKSTNQDSMLVCQAETGVGPVLLAAVCDGMGGLAKGELASATMVRSLSAWFREEVPALLAAEFEEAELRRSLYELITEVNRRLQDYSDLRHVEMGTTAVVLLIFGDYFYVMNVGDSRAYLLTEEIRQITVDQTYVQREMDAGRMTAEQAAVDPQRSVLLQCIGASQTIIPDFFSGPAAGDQVFLLCSDGFRHTVSPEEMFRALNHRAARNEGAMEKALTALTELNISRGEDDNISAVAVCTKM